MREHTSDMYIIQEENVVTEGGQYNNQRGFNQGNRGGFGRGRGRENFGRGGRGPIICYNCNQPRHLAHDFHNPCTTCTYCRALEHATKDCPQLLEKWQARGNQNQNLNQNVQNISTEIHDEGPKIVVVTHRGAKTGIDTTSGRRQAEQWVKKEAGPLSEVRPTKEKETYKKTRKEILGPNWVASTSSVPTYG
jgi:hypothetical protein